MIDDILTDVEFWSNLRDRFLRRVTPLFTELYLSGVRAGLRIERRGRKASEDEEYVELLQDPRFIARQAMFMTTYTNSWWQTLNASTQRELRKILIDARENGWTMPEIKKAIRPLFGPERAARIAVTETTRLFGAGAQATYEALGVEKWEWRTAEDERVDPTCDSLASGGPYSMDIPFVPAHVGCRCWPVPTLVQTGARHAA